MALALQASDRASLEDNPSVTSETCKCSARYKSCTGVTTIEPGPLPRRERNTRSRPPPPPENRRNRRKRPKFCPN
jgi:hypothetical protein